ncbi:hypothetical protein TRVL_04230 [Trypanosoma vivax]|nr:hypothetical protein TRVL_04230 [Trypanosoma vivax]
MHMLHKVGSHVLCPLDVVSTNLLCPKIYLTATAHGRCASSVLYKVKPRPVSHCILVPRPKYATQNMAKSSPMEPCFFKGGTHIQLRTLYDSRKHTCIHRKKERETLASDRTMAAPSSSLILRLVLDGSAEYVDTQVCYARAYVSTQFGSVSAFLPDHYETRGLNSRGAPPLLVLPLNNKEHLGVLVFFSKKKNSTNKESFHQAQKSVDTYMLLFTKL